MKKGKNIQFQETTGSITVEASFIMPIIVLTIFALIYLSFYLHDVCKIQGIVDKTLQKAALCVKHETDFATGAIDYENINDRGVFYLVLGSTKEEEKQINDFLVRELSNVLLLSKVTAVDTSVGKQSISVQVEVQTKISMVWVKRFFTSFSQIEIQGEHAIHDPAETLRRTEVALDTATKIKGVDKLKDSLENILQ